MTTTAEASEQALVYGPLFDQYLVFIPHSEAERLATLRRGLREATSWGALQEIVGKSIFSQVVEHIRENEEYDGDEVDESWGPSADAAFDAAAIWGFEDGDWPEWPAHTALEWVPFQIQQQYGKVELSVLNGEYLELPLEEERAIVSAFAAVGYTCRRDDALVLSAYGY